MAHKIGGKRFNTLNLNLTNCSTRVDPSLSSSSSLSYRGFLTQQSEDAMKVCPGQEPNLAVRQLSRPQSSSPRQSSSLSQSPSPSLRQTVLYCTHSFIRSCCQVAVNCLPAGSLLVTAVVDTSAPWGRGCVKLVAVCFPGYRKFSLLGLPVFVPTWLQYTVTWVQLI